MPNLPYKDCSGCSTCAEKCPKGSIKMIPDKEGFMYPFINEDLCIDCKLCEKICPVLIRKNKKDYNREPIESYVGYHLDKDIVKNSSSGGIFTALANLVIDAGGVVFGARFDENWNVRHDYAERKDELKQFQGSKYVQSKIGSSFKTAEKFLKNGKIVLFSGSPCQIAGLYSFLGKQYEKLMTVDFICHGVPSPEVWQKYLKEEIALQCEKNLVLPNHSSLKDIQIERISFRDKTLGWKKYSFAIDLSTTNWSGEKFNFAFINACDENPFLKGFLSDLFLRPSCYRCSFKSFSSLSDITIADAWGVEQYCPAIANTDGCSIILIFTNKSKIFFDKLKNMGAIKYIQIDKINIKGHNSTAYISPTPNRNRNTFFTLINKKGFTYSDAISKCLRPPTYWDKIVWSINKRIKKLLCE